MANTVKDALKNIKVCHITRLSITETALCIYFNTEGKLDVYATYGYYEPVSKAYSEKPFVRHNMHSVNLIEILMWQEINDKQPAIVDG